MTSSPTLSHDEAGRVVGVISIRDILDHLSENPGSVPLSHDFYVGGLAGHP